MTEMTTTARDYTNHSFHPVAVASEFSPEVNALTHTPPHHADEAFATAILSALYPMTVYCTRDPDLLQSFGGFIYDVGGDYNHDLKHYDHHQRDFSEFHDSGNNRYKMAAAGLVWRHYGERVVAQFPECPAALVPAVVKLVDRELISGLDGSDNGQVEDGPQLSLSQTFGLFNVNWDEDADPAAAFASTVAIAQQVLARMIISSVSYLKGKNFVEAAISKAPGRYFVMYKTINNWTEMVLESEFPTAQDLLYGITKDSTTGTWRVRALPPDKKHIMSQRKPFPSSWRGLSGEELARVTGVETAQFCHSSGFLTVAGTKQDAIKLAEFAIAAPVEK